MKHITLSQKAASRFRKRLTALQENIGIETVSAFALYLCLRRSTLSNWLNRKSLPSVQAVEKINKLLDERMEWSKTETESLQIYLTAC